MKNVFVLQIAMIGVMLFGCGQKSANARNDNAQRENEQQKDEKLEKTGNENSTGKFLITNRSVGYFTIGGSWQNFAEDAYNYKYVQGFGTCVDACCDGGFDLGKVITDIEDEPIVENPEITIGALIFDKSESETKHKSNSNVFYVSSDNCSGWYWKDKTSFMIVYSDTFKTKEGIGVGTALEKFQEIFGKFVITIGWLEEDANAIQIQIKAYPNIAFILDDEDAIGGYEKLSSFEGQTVTISDFKKNTQIKRLIIQ